MRDVLEQYVRSQNQSLGGILGELDRASKYRGDALHQKDVNLDRHPVLKAYRKTTPKSFTK